MCNMDHVFDIQRISFIYNGFMGFAIINAPFYRVILDRLLKRFHLLEHEWFQTFSSNCNAVNIEVTRLLQELLRCNLSWIMEPTVVLNWMMEPTVWGTQIPPSTLFPRFGFYGLLPYFLNSNCGTEGVEFLDCSAHPYNRWYTEFVGLLRRILVN